MKHSKTTLALAIAMATSPAFADTDQETIRALQQQVQELSEQLNSLADVVEEKQETSSAKKQVHIGGYGELHYANTDINGTDHRELDFHRMVLFFGYDFNDKARFVTEFEVEHIIASGGSRGAVELEQAYVEMDLRPNMHLQTGAMLMPIGIINETHEPPTFYGVERPIVETTIIPTTWWSTGMNFIHKLDNGIRYDIMIHEGLKTDDPSVNSTNDPFDLKAGKQKGSFASAFDLAVTGRIRYTGVPGLELAGYAQYQPDLDQSAAESYAEGATLLGGHVIYQWKDVTTKALYAHWDLDGDQAKAAGKDVQDGGYVELSWKPVPKWGVFARQSNWSQEADVDASQTDVGFNYWPYEDIVFKADYQMQNDDAGNEDGFHLGFGYQF